MARIVVIGAGVAGLSTAIRLCSRGHKVTIVEARDQVGGRAYQLRGEGFTFDMGPTLITAPHLLHAVWASAGRSMHEYVDLIPLRPFYEIRFADGERIDCGNVVAERPVDPVRPFADVTEGIEAEVRRVNPDDLAGYRRFMADTKALYDRAFEQLARKAFLSVWDMARVMPELVRSGAQRSVYSFVAGYVRNEHLRTILSFHPMFLGGNPFKASAIYSIIPHLEQSGGVWFPRGGTYALVSGMARLLGELGAEIRCGDAVAEIEVSEGRATGVRLTTGSTIPADIVISNADAASTYIGLLPASVRRRNSDRRFQRYSYSMSCFLLYLGVNRKYPDLRHHTVVMPRNYRSAVEAVFGGKLPASDLAVYLHTPTRTDPSLAPPGCESMYVLAPVPNLSGGQDWGRIGDDLRRRVIEVLRANIGLTDIEDHIVFERRFTPIDFRDQLRSYLGAAFSVEPTLFQSAYFRPHNRSEDVPNLYLVGAGTHPGAGLPGVLMSAEIAANLIGAA